MPKKDRPSTPEGKARSARNSYLHGLCAKDVVIVPEQQADFDHMAESYFFDLHPRRPAQQTLFSEIVGAAWQLGRVRRVEPEARAGQTTYTEILDDEVLQKRLDRLARHHTRIERTLHRCLKELKALQAQRRNQEPMPSHKFSTADLDAQLRRLNASALSAISERTQSAALRTKTRFSHPLN